jgi:hypothetical protein
MLIEAITDAIPDMFANAASDILCCVCRRDRMCMGCLQHWNELVANERVFGCITVECNWLYTERRTWTL